MASAMGSQVALVAGLLLLATHHAASRQLHQGETTRTCGLETHGCPAAFGIVRLNAA